MRRIVACLVLTVVLMASIAQGAWAIDRVDGMLTKLGRGTTNVFTGIFEIGQAVDTEMYENGFWRGIFVGTGRGIVKSVVRIGAGIYDVLTFPIEYPEDYSPVLEPEYLGGDMVSA